MNTEYVLVKVDREAHALAKAEAAKMRKPLQDFIRDAIFFTLDIPCEKKPEKETSTH
jgi:hypothetical protein